MPNISEHHSEQEWKNSYGKKGRVDLFVAGRAIGIDDLLEWGSEGVVLEISWWF